MKDLHYIWQACIGIFLFLCMLTHLTCVLILIKSTSYRNIYIYLLIVPNAMITSLAIVWYLDSITIKEEIHDDNK